MKIVFMGTPRIAADVLQKMVDAGFKPELVITQPDKEKNRGKKVIPSEVKELATELGIPVSQPFKIRGNKEFEEELKGLNPDIAVVIAYGKILPKNILDIPKWGCINVHASLLPKLRGASPIQHAILMGEGTTGVTIMQMDEGMDTGDMLIKEAIEIGDMNAEELSKKLGELGGELIVRALPLIEQGKLTPEKQDEAFATYTGMIRKENGKVSFGEQSAEEIKRMTKAYHPWPGVNGTFDGTPVKFCKVSAIDDSSFEGDLDETYIPGTVIRADNSGIYIKTAGGILIVEELQLAGKNKVDVGAFLRGHSVSKDSFMDRG